MIRLDKMIPLTLRETGKANYLMHSEIPTAVNSMRNKYHSGGKDIIKISLVGAR